MGDQATPRWASPARSGTEGRSPSQSVTRIRAARTAVRNSLPMQPAGGGRGRRRRFHTAGGTGGGRQERGRRRQGAATGGACIPGRRQNGQGSGLLESKPQFARFLLPCSTAISEALNGFHH